MTSTGGGVTVANATRLDLETRDQPQHHVRASTGPTHDQPFTIQCDGTWRRRRRATACPVPTRVSEGASNGDLVGITGALRPIQKSGPAGDGDLQHAFHDCRRPALRSMAYDPAWVDGANATLLSHTRPRPATASGARFGRVPITTTDVHDQCDGRGAVDAERQQWPAGATRSRKGASNGDLVGITDAFERSQRPARDLTAFNDAARPFAIAASTGVVTVANATR